MPITNGNYVSPQWRDNVPPPIDDTELQAISDTIVTSQILFGSGAPTTSTAGRVGQRYANTSTNPYTIYKLVSITSGSYNWTPETDPNANTARPYSTSSSYSAGAYCVYDGTLYRARQNITPEAWTEGHWERVYIAEALGEHVGNEENPHGVTAAQTGGLPVSDLSGVETGETASVSHEYGSYLSWHGIVYLAMTDISAGDTLAPGINMTPVVIGVEVSKQWPDTGTIQLSASWLGGDPYYQSVTITGATADSTSRVDIYFTPAQLDALEQDGVRAVMIENDGGVLTAYAVGAAPSAAMTATCLIRNTV